MSGLTPKLRFTNFRDEWRSSTLAKVAKSISAGKSVQNELGCYPIYGSTGRIGNTNQDDYQTENILIARVGANAGKTYQVSGHYGVTDNTLIVSLVEDVNNFFVFNSLSKMNLNRYVFGSGQPLITGTMLKKLKIHTPSLAEQQKIADFLSSVDAKIDAVKRKMNAFERYKKGLMQQIFSQKIRFKQDDGSDFPEWKEKRLGTYCEIISGLTYSPSDIVEEGLLVLRSSNVQNAKITLNDNVYVNISVHEKKITLENDILLCVRNGSTRLIGKSALVPAEIPLATHGAFMSVLRGRNNKFLFQLLQTRLFFGEVHKNLGATINSINGSDLTKFKFYFPSLPEQQKIADFLSSVDAKIDAVKAQIEKLEAFKKGLLQQMFV